MTRTTTAARAAADRRTSRARRAVEVESLLLLAVAGARANLRPAVVLAVLAVLAAEAEGEERVVERIYRRVEEERGREEPWW